MGKFCDECGKEMGMFSSNEIQAKDGRELVVCDKCESKVKAREAGGASSSPSSLASPPTSAPSATSPSSPSTHSGRSSRIQYGQSVRQAPASGGGGSRVVVLVVAMVGLLGAAGAGFFLVVGGEGEGARSSRGVAQTPATPAGRAASKSRGWKGKRTLRCRGHQRLTIKGVKAEGTRSVVRARDNCRLTLVNCTLSGRDALSLRGNASVVIKGGVVQAAARGAAITVRGKAKVVVEKAEVRGSDSGAIRLRDDAQAQIVATKIENTVKRGADAKYNMGRPLISLRGRARLSMDGGSLSAQATALQLRGDSIAVLKNVKATSENLVSRSEFSPVLEAWGPTFISVVGGSVTGKKKALSVKYGGKILLHNVTVEGKRTQKGGGSEIREVNAAEGAPSDLSALAKMQAEEKKRYELFKSYERVACSGVTACYKEENFVGKTSGKIELEVGPDGAVTKVRIKVKSTPGAVKKCLKKLSREKRIADFKGPPGTLICTYSYNLGQGFTMSNSGSDFIPKKK